MPRLKRILVSEDTALWQGIFQQVLPSVDYDVKGARNLDETLSLLDRCLFDVAIVDIGLDENDESNSDGIRTMERIKSLNEGTKAIVLTGRGTVELAVQSLREYQVFHFLEKERFNRQEFLRLIADATTKATYDRAALRLAQDAIARFQNVDMHKVSSMFGTRVDDLNGIIRGLMAEIGPVVANTAAVLAKEDQRGPSITFECWSKAYAICVRLLVTRVSAIASAEADSALIRRELGNAIGFVMALPEEPFERFVSI